MSGSSDIIKSIAQKKKQSEDKHLEVSTPQNEEYLRRTYVLKKSAVKGLNELKLDFYSPGTDLSEIVNDAIMFLLNSKKGCGTNE